MAAEIYGKKTGTCGGKGGSMHIADLDKGMMGANGIVGGGPPLVCGAGLAAKSSAPGTLPLRSWATAAPTRAHARKPQPRRDLETALHLRGRK